MIDCQRGGFFFGLMVLTTCANAEMTLVFFLDFAIARLAHCCGWRILGHDDGLVGNQDALGLQLQVLHII